MWKNEMKFICRKLSINAAVEILSSWTLDSDSKDTGRIKNQYESFQDCSVRLWEKESQHDKEQAKDCAIFI